MSKRELGDGEPSPPLDEELCQKCGRNNPVWFAPNLVWNAVVTEISGILCPICFIERADKQGFRCTGWELIPENSQISADDWLVLYAKLREQMCSCNKTDTPELGPLYDYTCEWCAEHPQGDWEHVKEALVKAGRSLDEPFEKVESGAAQEVSPKLLSAEQIAQKLANVGGIERWRVILQEWLDSYIDIWKQEEIDWRAQEVSPPVCLDENHAKCHEAHVESGRNQLALIEKLRGDTRELKAALTEAEKIVLGLIDKTANRESVIREAQRAMIRWSVLAG